jgi:hypothetical protein
MKPQKIEGDERILAYLLKRELAHASAPIRIKHLKKRN